MPNNNGQGPLGLIQMNCEKYINKFEVALFAAWKRYSSYMKYTYTDAEDPNYDHRINES